MPKEKIIATIGDPAGCGPYITLKAIESLENFGAQFFVVGDKEILNRFDVYKKISKRITLIDLDTPGINKLKPGYVSKLSGRASINYLKKALEVMSEYGVKRLVTAPLSKEAVQLNLADFSGHSEYLADYFECKIEMMMAAKKIKTVLFTRHIPFKKVPDFINEKNLSSTFNLVLKSLQELFKIKRPKIAVASLNPHAGINTFFGSEEKTIHKVVRKFNGNFYGPYPPDSLFTQDSIKQYDCIIALYHDQGMIPFKLLSMKTGVNLTIGLPIIRTSPAHGVALDIVRQNKKPFSSSMVEAIKLALRLSIPLPEYPWVNSGAGRRPTGAYFEREDHGHIRGASV
ncbi:MAG: 4-hydroxythreonine-4-phosphate dehydrogenase PdxA [Candidatus Omnitrophica bacterium]|jgi:4-hydroxythreonine-4-phosphate dehydrogenase|nr:4-hydroxythreonine-4-phosphate dehydrogenase PdxA [Candidatus Omnitrophota bacterium]